MNFNIEPVSRQLTSEIQNKIDSKTKPVGALGKLEELALRIGLVQQTTSPALHNPAVIVFAGDHGAARNSISAYPQEVTWQMVHNFLQGGGAINVFCRQHDIDLTIVDAGVNADFENHAQLVKAKIRKSTRDYLNEPAMTADECERAIQKGADLVRKKSDSGCNCIGLGEMGIGNTASASLLMYLFTGIKLERCVGKGTGLDDTGVVQKIDLLEEALKNGPPLETPLEKLACFGGYEIAMLCGAFLQAATERMVILVDGFIATAALLVASKLNENVLDYCIFCHNSDEKGHRLLLDHLDARPVLDLGMRLGEGTGAAVCYPIVQSAVAFLNEMASFESAKVSEKDA